jgi:hypothetical protein
MTRPSYLEKMKMKHPGLSGFDCERSILRGWKREWSLDRWSGPTKKTWAFHMLRYLKLLFPKQDIHPFMRRQVKAIEVSWWIKGREMINYIGSKDSGKTQVMAEISIALLTLDPEFTVIYAATPLLLNAKTTLWGRIGKLWEEMDKSMWQGAKSGNEMMTLLPGNQQAGFIEKKVFDKVAVMQGAKAPDERGKRGFLILLLDEVALFKNTSFRETLDNLLGKQRLMILTGCNFRDQDGLEGDLCKPIGREYESIGVDEDFYWDSSYNSFTLRLDGHRSPNIQLGYVKYNYLLKEAERARMEEQHGLTGPKYMEQIRSAPCASMASMIVITRADLTARGVFDTDLIWGERDRVRVAFCDPAWGGDEAVIQAFEIGRAHVFASDNKQVPIQIFTPICHPETIRLKVNMPFDREWQNRFEAAIRGKPYYRDIGKLVTFDQQIVVASYEFLLKHNVPLRNFGYDSSLRGSIVNEFSAIIGDQVVPVDPLQQASDRIVEHGKTAKEMYGGFLTETWFAVGDLARAGQLRGGTMLTTAIGQLVRRTYNNIGAKKQMEKKDDYRKRMGSSPNHADVLVGAVEMARRRGLVIGTRRTPTENPGSILDHLKGLRASAPIRIHRLQATRL